MTDPKTEDRFQEGQEITISTTAWVIDVGSNYIEVELPNGDEITVRTDQDGWKVESND